MKSSSGTVGALVIVAMLVDGSSLRCSSIRAPYTRTRTQLHVTQVLLSLSNNFRISLFLLIISKSVTAHRSSNKEVMLSEGNRVNAAIILMR